MLAASMSPRTITDRVQLVRRFHTFGADSLTCTWEPIAKFLADPNISQGSRATYLANLRQWFRFLHLMGLRADDPTMLLHKGKTPRRLPRPITTEQLGLILGSGLYRRTRTMILLEAFQGLRAMEVAKMRGEHIRGNRLRVIGKGGHDATIPLHPVIAAEAAAYPEIGWWFPSYERPGECVLARSVSRTVSDAMHHAGVEASGHALRHWHGTEILRASGGALRIAQEALRHQSPATTAIYTKVDDADQRAALEGLPMPMHSVGRSRPRPLPRS